MKIIPKILVYQRSLRQRVGLHGIQKLDSTRIFPFQRYDRTTLPPNNLLYYKYVEEAFSTIPQRRQHAWRRGIDKSPVCRVCADKDYSATSWIQNGWGRFTASCRIINHQAFSGHRSGIHLLSRKGIFGIAGLSQFLRLGGVALVISTVVATAVNQAIPFVNFFVGTPFAFVPSSYLSTSITLMWRLWFVLGILAAVQSGEILFLCLLLLHLFQSIIVVVVVAVVVRGWIGRRGRKG